MTTLAMNTFSPDLLASRLGFGCGRLKGGGDKATSLRLVHAALDLGIRYFDTAPPYGLGTSEAVLGDALKGRQEPVLVATKVGLARPASPGLLQKARAVVKPLARCIPGLRQAVLKGMARHAAPSNLDAAFVAQSFATSLQQLQRDRVDLVLLHEARSQHPLDPLQALFERAIDQGRLGAYGSSTGEPLYQLVRFGSVLQYRCPPPDATWTTVDPSDVLHGALRFTAPAIRQAMALDSRLTDQLTSLLPRGTEPASASGSLALAYALSRFDSRVLLSTNDPRRLVSTVEQLRHITASPGWRPAMLNLHAAFAPTGAPCEP
ncbi:aldo/keto reductase [Hydrogenophaga sp. BPS33]|uniref:aldo/keto reductase n=1 Tax=Hydrogenophaga sp. BPS33 TaxID=2651974 RepID=UPI001320482C|nr:aldo/keto reductase [Hydrogenophaga sp. BPS33]QHE88540.1 aldo/keto reductase [Hydrogenophaga sp. BPS33]